MPLRLALPLQDGGGVEQRGAPHLVMLRGRRRHRRRRREGMRAVAGEESRLDDVHRGGVRQPSKTAAAAGGGWWLPSGDGTAGGVAVALREREGMAGSVWVIGLAVRQGLIVGSGPLQAQ